ncbi:MAG TPA: hypothetical protein VLL97_04955 [Acidobacteriota bacterium]|nr:hypothetical protein [Acidobacteriota bacterium]
MDMEWIASTILAIALLIYIPYAIIKNMKKPAHEEPLREQERERELSMQQVKEMRNPVGHIPTGTEEGQTK